MLDPHCGYVKDNINFTIFCNKILQKGEKLRFRQSNTVVVYFDKAFGVCSTQTFSKNKMLSVNQMQAQIKLTELWKAVNTENNPLKFKHQVAAENGRESRTVSNKTLVLNKGSTLTNDDASKLWNNAPEDLKNTKTLYSAKLEIKKYCASLPM